MNIIYEIYKKKRKRCLKKITQASAVCLLDQSISLVSGIIRFKELNNRVKINYEIYGLTDGEHGFHVHELGDLTKGCVGACGHFNPHNKNHGDRKDKERHVGDLGNILSKNKIAKGYFYDNVISLDLKNKNCIIGRSIVIHEKKDDLGKGSNAESLITGNAGKRVGCGVIGISR